MAETKRGQQGGQQKQPDPNKGRKQQQDKQQDQRDDR